LAVYLKEFGWVKVFYQNFQKQGAMAHLVPVRHNSVSARHNSVSARNNSIETTESTGFLPDSRQLLTNHI